MKYKVEFKVFDHRYRTTIEADSQKEAIDKCIVFIKQKSSVVSVLPEIKVNSPIDDFLNMFGLK
jgi:hypothetical protein